MSIHANMYMHDLDRSTLKSLKAIPGFAPLMKAYMKVAAEQQYYIQNMSTNLRLGPKQLPHYYDMLHPICEKLGIPVPELYLKMDDSPNAYTFGDTKPFIVMTDGLLEIMPDELIPTILAHECGHIACHHTLYHNLGSILLSGGSSALGLSDLVTVPLQSAFYYWMRCSEYSADRAAAICDGSAERVKEMCMRFSGFGRREITPENMEAYMEQVEDYHKMMQDSKWSKTLEILMYHQADHPLNAARAYESNLWQCTDNFHNIQNYLLDSDTGPIPLPEGTGLYLGKPAEIVRLELAQLGFRQIRMNRVVAAHTPAKPGNVLEICINGRVDTKPATWYPQESEVIVSFFEPLTQLELQAAHPGELSIPNSARYYIGKPLGMVMQELQMAGFRNISVTPCPPVSSIFGGRIGTVSQIQVDGKPYFERGFWFPEEAAVQIVYYG
jgi:Zn-dependent protease with chaperone function